MLRRFIDVMIKTGMEKCLAFTGWMTACHVTSVVDPVVAEIVFFRKPSTPAVSLDLVQAFIHSALVTLAMPRLKAEANDAIKTKVKLWGVSIFRIYCQGIYLSKTFSTYGIKLPPSQTLKRSCDLRVILGALPILILPCAITPGVVPTMKRWPHFPSLVLCMEVDLEATRSQIHDFQIQQKNALAFF